MKHKKIIETIHNYLHILNPHAHAFVQTINFIKNPSMVHGVMNFWGHLLPPVLKHHQPIHLIKMVLNVLSIDQNLDWGYIRNVFLKRRWMHLKYTQLQKYQPCHIDLFFKFIQLHQDFNHQMKHELKLKGGNLLITLHFWYLKNIKYNWHVIQNSFQNLTLIKPMNWMKL